MGRYVVSQTPEPRKVVSRSVLVLPSLFSSGEWNWTSWSPAYAYMTSNMSTFGVFSYMVYVEASDARICTV